MKTPNPQLEKARHLLDEGDETGARDIVLAWRTKAPDDPEIHAAWGQLCEELGMAKQARDSYERALRIDSKNGMALFLLASLLGETGHFEESVRYLKKVLGKDPEHPEAKSLLAEHYRLLGLDGQAEMISPSSPKSLAPERYFPPNVGREDVARFMSLFAGREAGYSLQWIDEDTGADGYEFMESSLAPYQVERHIEGEITLAVYPLRGDNTVKFAAVGIRPRKRVIEANLKNRGYLAYLEEKARYEALNIRRSARRIGVSAYVDQAGARTYRVWFFFREFMHFLNVRDFLKRLLIDRSEYTGPFVIETLTGTKGVGIGWREHPVLLPLGLNRATGERILFLDDDGEPYREQLAFLKKIREVSFRKALDGFRGLSGSLTGKGNIGGHSLDPWIKRCPVIEELSRKTGSGKMLRHKERIILYYTVGLADEDGAALHGILETCPDYRYSSVENQRERLKPNPMSCAKIRELVPEITASANCNCSFDLRGGKYPSPLLHLKPDLVQAPEELEIPDGLPIREVAKRHLNLIRQLTEIERAVLRTSAVLEGYFQKKGLERIRLGKAALVRRQGQDGMTWVIEGRT